MKKRYSEEQIINILAEVEAGSPLVEVARKYGISTASYYKWKAKFGGMDVSEAKRLKSLEEENPYSLKKARR
jgi:putative transposase